MRHLEKEITSGRNLSTNIPEFFRQMLGTYHRYSFVKLSMNYFTYYEMVKESEVKDERILALTDRYNEIIRGILDGADVKASVEQMEHLREELIQIMSILTAWVDRFNIYEYCLNRAEYHYKDRSQLPQLSDEELARDILQYLVSDKDQMVVNEKISELVRQLPMRMTRSKFFQLLKEGMKVYKDSEKGSVDDLIYMLRTVSTLEEPEGMMEFSPVVTEVYEELAKTDFLQLDEEQFNALSSKLQYAINEIDAAVSCYMLLAENVNDAYVVLLSSHSYCEAQIPALFAGCEDYMKDDKDYQNCRRLIEKEAQLFADASYEELCEELEDGFFALEGKQEKYWERFQKFGYLIETITGDEEELLEELGLTPCEELFGRIEKLVSGSIFVTFDEDDTKHKIAGTDYVEAKADALEEELRAFFAEHKKNVNRAVMAHILAELPVFFNNMEEIQNYVLSSLSGCGDDAEKAAVTEIMVALTNEE